MILGGGNMILKTNINCGIKVKDDGIYDAQMSSKFQKRYKRLLKSRVKKIGISINKTIEMLCNESDMDILKSKLHFHKLNNYTLEVNGTKYEDPYDIHIPGGGSNNNNDLVILFDYDHVAKQI